MNQQLLYRYTLSLSKNENMFKEKTKQYKTKQNDPNKRKKESLLRESWTIVCYLGGIWSRLEPLERIYGRFPSMDPSGCFAWVPNLDKPYIYREKTVTYIHTWIHTYIFLLKSFHFRRLHKRLVFSPYKSLSNVTQPPDADARRCSYFELGLPVGKLIRYGMCRIRRISCDYTFNDQCLRLHPLFFLNTNSGTGHRYTTPETVKE